MRWVMELGKSLAASRAFEGAGADLPRLGLLSVDAGDFVAQDDGLFEAAVFFGFVGIFKLVGEGFLQAAHTLVRFLVLAFGR